MEINLLSHSLRRAIVLIELVIAITLFCKAVISERISARPLASTESCDTPIDVPVDTPFNKTSPLPVTDKIPWGLLVPNEVAFKPMFRTRLPVAELSPVDVLCMLRNSDNDPVT